MRRKERRDSGQADLLRSRLDAITDMNQAGADDRLVIPRGAVRRDLRGQAWPAAAADAPDGRIGHPQAHL